MDEMYRKLARALSVGGDLYTLEDILGLIKTGDIQSFTDGNTWVLTRVLDYPRRRVLELFLVVGDMNGVRGLNAEIEQHAENVGATRIIAEGRPGWNSVASSFGWTASTVNFYKEL